jgi:hypothetical protein
MWLGMHVIPGAMSSALRGMSAASWGFDKAAQDVADDAADPSGDLPGDLVEATVLAPAAYTANAVVARTAAEMQGSLLDMRA